MKFKTSTLGKIAIEIKTGKTPPTINQKYFGNEIPWYTPGDLDKEKDLVDSQRGITQIAIDEKKAILFKPNTVLIGCIGEIGKIGIAKTISSSNQQITGILPEEKEIISDFLYYWVKKNKRLLQSASTSSIVPILNNKQLATISISFPEDITDQIKIAKVFSKVEVLIKHRQKTITLLDEFIKSTFYKMFGDPIRNEKNWSKDYLENLVAGDCPLTYGIVQPGEDYPNGTPVIRPVDLTKSHITREGLKLIDPRISQKFKRTILKGNEILMCVRGSTGIVAYATAELKGCNVTRGITPIWFDSTYEKLFAYFLFKSNAVQREISKYTYGSTLQQINLSDLRLLNLIKPSIEIQKQFVSIAEKCEEIKKYFDGSLIKLKNLFDSLNQKAFNGELDLSKLDVEDIISKSDSGSDAKKIHIQEESKPKQKLEIVETYKGKIAKKKKTEITNQKTNWDSVSTQQLANWIKEKYTGFHFSSEMLIRFLIKEHVDYPVYYSSEELKKYPTANESDDLKSLIFSALGNENPFLKLDQVFYNAETENIQLNVTEEDFELIKDYSAKERSGIYFNIIE